MSDLAPMTDDEVREAEALSAIGPGNWCQAELWRVARLLRRATAEVRRLRSEVTALESENLANMAHGGRKSD